LGPLLDIASRLGPRLEVLLGGGDRPSIVFAEALQPPTNERTVVVFEDRRATLLVSKNNRAPRDLDSDKDWSRQPHRGRATCCHPVAQAPEAASTTLA
jgi:hypothetical protein